MHLSFDHRAGAGNALVTPAPMANQVGDGAEVGVDGELMPRGVVAGGLILEVAECAGAVAAGDPRDVG